MEKVLEHERSLLTTALSSSSLAEGAEAVAAGETAGINLQTLRDQVTLMYTVRKCMYVCFPSMGHVPQRVRLGLAIQSIVERLTCLGIECCQILVEEINLLLFS